MIIKENQTSQVNEFSAFLCLGRCLSLGSLKSFDMHLSYLGLVSLSPSLSPLRVHYWGSGAHGLMATAILCLQTWKATLFHLHYINIYEAV